MLVKSLLVWMALLTLAVLDGAFRETLLTPRFGGLSQPPVIPHAKKIIQPRMILEGPWHSETAP